MVNQVGSRESLVDLMKIVQLLDDRARFAEDPQRRDELERTHIRLRELLSRLAGDTPDSDDPH